MGSMCDMCHHFIGRKSKVMESQWESDTGQDENIPLDLGPKQIRWGGEEDRGEKKKEKRENRERGERNSNFSIRSMEIDGSAFIGQRNKDHMLDKGYAWVSKT